MRQFFFAFVLLALCTIMVAGDALAQRQGERPFKGGSRSLATTYVTDANELVQALVGPNVMVRNATLVGAPASSGTFTGGTGIIGFDSGVLLGTGDIAFVPGPNVSDSATLENQLAGDPDLDNLIPGSFTRDATILEFEFLCPELTSFTIEYVFSSEEYNEYVDSEFNDIFAFFLNGVGMADNITTVPSFCSHPDIPVAINNVNCQNPYLPPDGLNCNCYINNDLSDGGPTVDTEMDGLTYVFFATGDIIPDAWNQIKIAIADVGDMAWDSNVFLKGESFDCGGAPELGACCDGLDCNQLTFEECLAGQYDPGWAGAGVPCDPNPCGAPPVCNPGGPYEGSAGEPVQFDGSGSFDPDGSIVAYEWDFGDGTTGTGVAPVHTYENDGDYVVSLCVTDNDDFQSCCTSEPVVPIEVEPWGTIKSHYR